MKIEKINDNQIRCTLNKADLAARHLKISELAYGSDKAKALFRDMMQQASAELGFDAEDIPLMIEAIPVSAECIVLIVTKVDDPEELDTRFSRFSSDNDDDNDSFILSMTILMTLTLLKIYQVTLLHLLLQMNLMKMIILMMLFFPTQRPQTMSLICSAK